MNDPFDAWGRLNRKIVEERLSFTSIQEELLRILWRLDERWKKGAVDQGLYRQKGNYYRDTITSLIRARCLLRGADVVLKERTLQGRTDVHKVDFAFPESGDPIVAGEVKAIGSPPHRQYPERPIGIDVDKRIKEVKYTPVDLKRRAAPTISKPWQEWVKHTKPKFYVFWIMRRGARNSVDKILGKVASILEYANGVSAVMYEERERSYAYIFTGGNEISTVDGLTREICDQILER